MDLEEILSKINTLKKRVFPRRYFPSLYREVVFQNTRTDLAYMRSRTEARIFRTLRSRSTRIEMSASQFKESGRELVGWGAATDTCSHYHILIRNPDGEYGRHLVREEFLEEIEPNYMHK